MDPFKSAPIRDKFRTIHYIFYVEYERLEFLLNYPTTLLNMEFVDKEESKKTQSIQVMDLDELEKRLSKGYRFYKKIRTTLNLKEEWDFVKLKILFMRQYSQLFVDGFEPDRGYFYLEKASDLVEKRRRIHRNPYEDDVHFYRYLVEIDRTNFFILTNQYRQLLLQCEVYIECASRLEEYRRKPFNILVPFRIYVGCGMIYEFFNQENDIIVNTFLRGVQIIEKNSDDVGRYFLQNDLLIYVQAYVKIVKCKIRLKDYVNAEQWARSTLKFIQDNTYLLRLEPESKIVKKIQYLHKLAITELVAMDQLKLEKQRQQQLQMQKNQNKKFLADESGSFTGKHSNNGTLQHIKRLESDGINSHIDDPMLVIDKSVEVSDLSISRTQVDDTQNATTNNQNETQQMQQTTQSIDPSSSRLDITHINHYQQFNEAINRQKRLEDISKRLIGAQNIQSHFKPISQIKQEIAENNEQIDMPILNKQQQLNKEFYNYPPSSLLSPMSDSHQINEKKGQEKGKEKENNKSKSNNIGSPKKEATSIRSSEEDDGEEEEDEEYSLGDSDDDDQQMISIFGKKKDKKNKQNTSGKNDNSKKGTNEEIENDITGKNSNYNYNISEVSKISSQTLVASPSNAGMLKSGRFSSQTQINQDIKAITENGEEEDSPVIPKPKGHNTPGVVIPSVHRFQPITPVSLKNLYDIPRLSFHEAADQLLGDSNVHSAEVLDQQMPNLTKKSSQNKLQSEGNSNQTEQATTLRSISGIEQFPQIQHKGVRNPATDKEIQPLNGVQQIQLLRITSMKQIPEAQDDDSPRRKTQEYNKIKNNDIIDGWNNNEKDMVEMKEFDIQFTKAVSESDENIADDDDKEKNDNNNNNTKDIDNKLFEISDKLRQQQPNRVVLQQGDQKDQFKISVFEAGSESNQDNNKLESQELISQIGSDITKDPQGIINKPTITIEQEEQGTLSIQMSTSNNPKLSSSPQINKGILKIFPFMKTSMDMRKSSVLDTASDGLQSHFGSQPRKSSTNQQNSFDQTIETLNSCQTIGLPQGIEHTNTNNPISIPLNLLSPQTLKLHQAVGLPRKSIFSDQKNEVIGLAMKNAKETQSSEEDSSISSKPSNEEDQSQVYHSPRRQGSQKNEGKDQLFKRFMTSTDIRAKQKADWKRLQLNTYFKSSMISTLLPNSSPLTVKPVDQKGKQIGMKVDNTKSEQSKTPGRILTARKGIQMELPVDNNNNSSNNKLDLRKKIIEQLKSHHHSNNPSGIMSTINPGNPNNNNNNNNPPNYFLLWKQSQSHGSQTERQGSSSNNKQIQNHKKNLNEHRRYYATKLDGGHDTDRGSHGEHVQATPRAYSQQNHLRTVTQATIASFRASPGRGHQEEYIFQGSKTKSVQVSPFKERLFDNWDSHLKDNNNNSQNSNNYYHKNGLIQQQKSQDSTQSIKGNMIPHGMTAEERHYFHQLIQRKNILADQKNSNNSGQILQQQISRAATPKIQRVITNLQDVMMTPQRDNSMKNIQMNILITPPPQSNQNSLSEESAVKMISQKNIQFSIKMPRRNSYKSQ